MVLIEYFITDNKIVFIYLLDANYYKNKLPSYFIHYKNKSFTKKIILRFTVFQSMACKSK